MSKEPKDATMLAARIARAYPSLSAYSSATLAESLCAIERAQRRHAERCCSGDYKVWHGSKLVHDPNKEDVVGRRIDHKVSVWCYRTCRMLYPNGDGKRDLTIQAELLIKQVKLQGDPRGPVLLLTLPGESEPKAV